SGLPATLGWRGAPGRTHLPRPGTAVPVTPVPAPAVGRNWIGSSRFTPREVLAPATEAQVLDALAAARAAGCGLRVVGAGHSFSALVATDGILLTQIGRAHV